MTFDPRMYLNQSWPIALWDGATASNVAWALDRPHSMTNWGSQRCASSQFS